MECVAEVLERRWGPARDLASRSSCYPRNGRTKRASAQKTGGNQHKNRACVSPVSSPSSGFGMVDGACGCGSGTPRGGLPAIWPAGAIGVRATGERNEHLRRGTGGKVSTINEPVHRQYRLLHYGLEWWMEHVAAVLERRGGPARNLACPSNRHPREAQTKRASVGA